MHTRPHCPRPGPRAGLAAGALVALVAFVLPCRAGEAEAPRRPRPPVRVRPPAVTGPVRGDLPTGPEIPPEELPARYHGDLGEVHLQYRQWTKAEESFRQAYEAEKDAARRAQFAHRLAQLLIRKEEHEKALPLLKEALDNAPQGARSTELRRYRTTLAHLYETLGQLEKAEGLYQEWLKSAAEGTEQTMARRELLRFWHRAGKLDAAIHIHEAALKEDPKDKEALETLRLIYTTVRPHPEKAVAVTEKLVALEPENREAALGLLTAYERARKYDQAIALAQKLIQQEPAQAAYLSTRLVYLCIQSGQKEKGLEYTRAMLEQGPKTSELHGRVASLFLQLGQTDEALAQYEAAAKLAKQDAERERHLLSAAHAARRAKKYDKAEEYALQLTQSASKPVVAQAKRLLFEIYDEQNKLDQLKIAPRKR